jgi:hypothetical protein
MSNQLPPPCFDNGFVTAEVYCFGFWTLGTACAHTCRIGAQESAGRRIRMCDYSLHGIENRLAVEGEILVIHRFSTGSKGLTSPQSLEPANSSKGLFAFLASKFIEPTGECAVCIPDGAQLSWKGISESNQYALGISSEEPVTFRQLFLEGPGHRDAIELRDGKRIRLQELEEGETLAVRALTSEKTNPSQEILRDFQEL